MEFPLIYEGPLHAGGNSTRHAAKKHEIRKVIHKQLKYLWGTHPLLKLVATRASTRAGEYGRSFLNILAQDNERFGYAFVPLVNERYDQICALDILLLRRERPGALITQCGDVDNRLKLLFDALSVPESASGITPPKPDETPFYCLLQKDSLVSEVKVTMDRLLTPPTPDEKSNHVYAVIGVKAQAATPMMWGNLMFKE